MKRGFVEDCVRRSALTRRGRERTVLIFTDGRSRARRWTCGELSQTVDAFAAGLRASGLRPGHRLLLKLPNGPEFPVAFFGSIRAGAIPVPVSPLLTRSETRFLSRDSGAKLVLDEPAQVRRLMKSSAQPVAEIRSRPSDPAFWLYTSGTEGRPKAVIHAHRSIPSHDARNRSWLDLKKDDIVFNTSAANWSYALTCGLADVLRAGAVSVVFSGPLDPKILLDVIHEQRVTIFMSVPGLYRRLTEFLERHPSKRRLLRSVRVCLSAGEKLPSEIRARFRKATGLTIREGLGMTEHSVYIVQPKGSRCVEGSCGRALPGHPVAILKDDLTPARPGEIGILASHRSCPGLMLGYYRRPDEERRVFRGEWFLSGDLAYRDVRGNFFYVGRRDDVITAGGYRISPMEVEGVLNRHPAVKESIAAGREIEPGKTVVMAYVALKKGEKGAKSLRHSLVGFVSQRLARYKTPREIVFVRELPKTSNGKLIRKKFRSL